LHYDANITFRIIVKIIQGYGVGTPEIDILARAGVQTKNQPEPRSVQNLGPSRSYGHLRGSSGFGSLPRS